MLCSVSNYRFFKLTVVTKAGEKVPINFNDGQTLFDAVSGTKAEGLQGKCGGSQVCGECHCKIPQNLYVVPDDDEKELLASGQDVTPTSRLACNLALNSKFDGATIEMTH
ncbi:Ferredoxin 4 [Trichomonas vaginalis G3]|uniref:Ferredoxin 4 n=1 Tax=Trichomonas vaginalis (strain ATCC PRA-98 / G3) TaxID=412133 RepID=A2F0E3_TRIV3|nr:2 iron, 2 sulfur cluster binding [Trichomonas vaginalis G3]EAY01638.1 Ferredoxin 4 [Trichomonas vaginalis G3]KAI5551603.1 2 iron, 2 sulfur cluster binding [Trichomonas vaginalis G3]|eukprot:XP_001330370.1 Ferredoxin 4 [Trichomonas vaginalis G3]